MARLELFGSAQCAQTERMRDWLEFRGVDFVEYDVSADAGARRRLLSLPGSQRLVPVLVEEGKIVQVGWQGRGCIIDAED